MSVSRQETSLATPAQTLQTLGVTASAERVYRTLLRGPDDTLRELAASAGISAAQARRAVADLESAGLLSRRATRPIRYVPAAPGTAVEALILQREKELEGCRLLATELTAEFRNSVHSELATQVIEVITDRDVVFQRYVQLLEAASTEVLMFDKPPYIGPLENPFEMKALERGVSWHGLYAPEGLYPDRMEQIRCWVRSGEKARVHPEVPMKLVIVDRELALTQMMAGGHGAEDTALLLRPCALLDTLILLFDSFWRRAVPLSRNFPQPADDGRQPSEEDDDLLRLLAAGFKDDAIARQLGVSSRTVSRKLADIMRENGVSTRFQLGLLLARQGWL
jgi:DNA-binding CsgD family transcriptional regulator/DNA-binding MarR family transcriptional regulator